MPEHIKQIEWKETKHVKYVYLISLLISCHHTVFHMAQHVVLAAQLVPQYKPIGRCNNYVVLQSIPCSPECKIVGLILLDHCTEQFIYTLDMFRDTLQLPVETPENPFVAPANIHTIEAFMNRVGYQGVVDKVSAFFTKNLAEPGQTMFKVFNISDLMKKFPNIPKRIKDDYHSIKDDVPLVSVYTTGNVSVRGMLISDAFLTTIIWETNDFKEYEMVFMKVVVPMNQPQLVVSTQGTNRNTPTAHRSPTVSVGPLEMKKMKQTAG
ncbi:hypothetical protein Tco_0712252 [Tanacetum coccineum]